MNPFVEKENRLPGELIMTPFFFYIRTNNNENYFRNYFKKYKFSILSIEKPKDRLYIYSSHVPI